MPNFPAAPFAVLSLALACWIGFSSALHADPATSASSAREWRQANEQQVVDAFIEFLSIPNVASDASNIRRNALHIEKMLLARDFEVRLLESGSGPPAVFASRPAPGAVRTLLVYAHYDGQPVEPAKWASEPWTPLIRTAPVELGGERVPIEAPFDPEWRLFARSAGDDKGPIIALAAALDALEAAGIPLSVNLKLFLDGEEEVGSPHLRSLLRQHRALLDADLWLFCDGPVHQSRRWQLVYGVRGAVGFELTVYGANRPLHSGHYGNWAPNPIVMLTALIGSMRDPQGNILIEAFHDEVEPPTPLERQAIDQAPPVDADLITELGIAQAERDERLELAIMRPALNLRGIRSGAVGAAARNSIPTEATASIGLRLVPDQTPAHLRMAVERHIERQGYTVVTEPPTAARRSRNRIAFVDWREAGYPAYRAPLDQPMAQSVAAIMNELRAVPLIRMPTMGGSLPIHVIEDVVGTPVVILPIANHDNNQHGSNENLRLQNLWDAIEVYAALLSNL